MFALASGSAVPRTSAGRQCLCTFFASRPLTLLTAPRRGCTQLSSAGRPERSSAAEASTSENTRAAVRLRRLAQVPATLSGLKTCDWLLRVRHLRWILFPAPSVDTHYRRRHPMPIQKSSTSCSCARRRSTSDSRGLHAAGGGES